MYISFTIDGFYFLLKSHTSIKKIRNGHNYSWYNSVSLIKFSKRFCIKSFFIVVQVIQRSILWLITLTFFWMDKMHQTHFFGLHFLQLRMHFFHPKYSRPSPCWTHIQSCEPTFARIPLIFLLFSTYLLEKKWYFYTNLYFTQSLCT